MDQSWMQRQKYHALIGTYIVLTGGAALRIWRQPYSRNIKVEQIESVFKGTTLGAMVIGTAISGQINRLRSSD